MPSALARWPAVWRHQQHPLPSTEVRPRPTPNAGVKPIQRALNKAIRPVLMVDGEFGAVTRRAYTAWQKYAYGLPAPFSLGKLSKTRGARFTITL
jgi:hypothetical protein